MVEYQSLGVVGFHLIQYLYDSFIEHHVLFCKLLYIVYVIYNSICNITTILLTYNTISSTLNIQNNLYFVYHVKLRLELDLEPSMN